jgi:hypothetical protein
MLRLEILANLIKFINLIILLTGLSVRECTLQLSIIFPGKHFKVEHLTLSVGSYPRRQRYDVSWCIWLNTNCTKISFVTLSPVANVIKLFTAVSYDFLL